MGRRPWLCLSRVSRCPALSEHALLSQGVDLPIKTSLVHTALQGQTSPPHSKLCACSEKMPVTSTSLSKETGATSAGESPQRWRTAGEVKRLWPRQAGEQGMRRQQHQPQRTERAQAPGVALTGVEKTRRSKRRSACPRHVPQSCQGNTWLACWGWAATSCTLVAKETDCGAMVR